MWHEMLLVCHAADGYFADGNRLAVQRLLDRAAFYPHPHYEDLYRPTDGEIYLFAPGLNSTRSFHRIGLHVEQSSLTHSLLCLVYDLMLLGGFGLMTDLEACSLVVTSIQQARSYPWLPEPPYVVRTAGELVHLLREPAQMVCA